MTLWSAEHEQAFTKAKEHLIEVPTLAYFSLDKPTRLCTDASRHGVGFMLQQQQVGSEQWSMIQAGSRFITPAESRYAVIELELLAVAWAVMKSNMFLCGLKNFQVLLLLFNVLQHIGTESQWQVPCVLMTIKQKYTYRNKNISLLVIYLVCSLTVAAIKV